MKKKSKDIRVRYLVMDSPSSYYMIIGCSTFNQLGAILSILYLCIKYMFSYRQVGVIQGDQEISMKCYVESLKLKRVHTLGANTKKVGLRLKLLGEIRRGNETPPQTCKDTED